MIFALPLLGKVAAGVLGAMETDSAAAAQKAAQVKTQTEAKVDATAFDQALSNLNQAASQLSQHLQAGGA